MCRMCCWIVFIVVAIVIGRYIYEEVFEQKFEFEGDVLWEYELETVDVEIDAVTPADLNKDGRLDGVIGAKAEGRVVTLYRMDEDTPPQKMAEYEVEPDKFWFDKVRDLRLIPLRASEKTRPALLIDFEIPESRQLRNTFGTAAAAFRSFTVVDPLDDIDPQTGGVCVSEGASHVAQWCVAVRSIRSEHGYDIRLKGEKFDRYVSSEFPYMERDEDGVYNDGIALQDGFIRLYHDPEPTEPQVN